MQVNHKFTIKRDRIVVEWMAPCTRTLKKKRSIMPRNQAKQYLSEIETRHCFAEIHTNKCNKDKTEKHTINIKIILYFMN